MDPARESDHGCSEDATDIRGEVVLELGLNVYEGQEFSKWSTAAAAPGTLFKRQILGTLLDLLGQNLWGRPAVSVQQVP